MTARLLVVVPDESDPPARLGDWLREAGMELDERHLGTGDVLPADLGGFDGLVVLGGAQSALDDETTSPELVGVRSLLKQALEADLPTLAICLAAQLLADVGGGTVRGASTGPRSARPSSPSATPPTPTPSSGRCRCRRT